MSDYAERFTARREPGIQFFRHSIMQMSRGKDAMSPVSGTKFEYKKTTDGFELVRPRPKGKAA